MDRLDAMAAFVAVAELRGFAAAARRLRRSASSVTRLVAALEDELAIELLKRTTRSVTLTDAGARYLDRARRILADVDDAEHAARAEASEPAGRFVVAAPRVFGRREVAPIVSDLLVRYPALRCELTLEDRVVSFSEEGIDAAVRIGQLPDSALRVRGVGAVRRVVVASPGYLAAHPRVRSPADLARHALIHPRGLGGAAEWRFVHRGADLRVAIEPALVTNSAEAAIVHAERGGGLALVLSYQVADQLRAGTLAIVLASYEPPPLPVQVVYPASRHPGANLRAFLALAAARAWDFTRF